VKDEVVEPEITVEDSSFRSFSNGEEHRLISSCLLEHFIFDRNRESF
jgi:hypothetical protein